VAQPRLNTAKREHCRVLARKRCLQQGGADRDRELGAVAAYPAERAGVQAPIEVLGGRQQRSGIGARSAADSRRRVQSRLAIITISMRQSSNGLLRISVMKEGLRPC